MANEELNKECEELRAAGGRGTTAQVEKAPEVEDEVRHLQAQNSALQKNLMGMRGKNMCMHACFYSGTPLWRLLLKIKPKWWGWGEGLGLELYGNINPFTAMMSLENDQ